MLNYSLLLATVLQIPHTGVWTTPQVIDMTKDISKFDVMTDGKSHYIARLDESADYELFYGNGKDFYLVDTRARFLKRTKPDPTDIIVDWRFEHYLVDEGRPSTIEFVSPGVYRVLCNTRWTELKVLPKEEGLALLQKAVFHRSPFDWIPYALARDEEGNYYYVDRGRWTDNERMFRVFSGKKGSVKPVKLENVAHDSEGDVFSTARGELRLVVGFGEGWWVKNKKKMKLTIIPLDQNLPMIFNELGMYEGVKLGTPCDDL